MSSVNRDKRAEISLHDNDLAHSFTDAENAYNCAVNQEIQKSNAKVKMGHPSAMQRSEWCAVSTPGIVGWWIAQKLLERANAEMSRLRNRMRGMEEATSMRSCITIDAVTSRAF